MTSALVESLCRRGVEHHDHGAHALALAAFQQALSTDPASADALTGIACSLDALGDWPGGLRHHLRALADAPTDAAEVNAAMALLLHGRLREGWARFEHRYTLPSWSGVVNRDSLLGNAHRRLRPGAPLSGKRILVFAEQGFGDTLQFARYLPLLAAAGARVTLICPRPLQRLLAALPAVEAAISPPDEGFALNLNALPHDWHASIMSLPWVFGTTLDTVPARVPYLAPPSDLVAAWRCRLPEDGRLKVGLVWAGNPRLHQPRAALTDRQRSLPPHLMDGLAGLDGVCFVSLQKGADRDRPTQLDLLDPMDEVRDFADTAALVANLDMVISVDTSVCHLAGALGKPVWVLSRFDGCWRWLLERRDSPWYPTLRLYRQPAQGEWDPVIRQVAADLATLHPFRPRVTPRSLPGMVPATPRRLELPDVTLVCADTRMPRAALRALERCRAACGFARVLFFTDAAMAMPEGIERVPIPTMTGRSAYSRFVVKDLLRHVETPFVLVVQWDGFITDPSRWGDEFRAYDYIGARWPWHRDGLQVGNGGFSLRSRRLLEALQDHRITDIDQEDDAIGRRYRRFLEEEHGIVFAPAAVADRFAYEWERPAAPSFGVHGLFNLWRHLDRNELAAVLAEVPDETKAELQAPGFVKALVASGRADDVFPMWRAFQAAGLGHDPGDDASGERQTPGPQG